MSYDVKSLGKLAAIIAAFAVVVLMAMAITAGYSRVLRDSSTNYNTTIALPATVNATAAVGTTGQYPFLQTCTDCYNETGGEDYPFPTECYNIGEGGGDGGVIRLLDEVPASYCGNWTSLDINCTITYLADTTEQGIADTFTTGLGVFGAFAGIIVLAIVGMIIMNLFRKGKGKSDYE